MAERLEDDCSERPPRIAFPVPSAAVATATTELLKTNFATPEALTSFLVEQGIDASTLFVTQADNRQDAWSVG